MRARVNKLIEPVFNFLFPAWQETLKKEVRGLSVLDLGCGDTSPVRHCETSRAVGLDIYQSALEKAKKNKTHNEYLLRNILETFFPSNSFDVIVATGLLEHLDKEDGMQLLEQMKYWCRKKVLVTMPNGWLWQDAIDGNPYQVHRSAYTVGELKAAGYKVYGIYGLKWLRGYCARLKWRPNFFWAVVSGITQYFCKHNPQFAHSLMAIYKK